MRGNIPLSKREKEAWQKVVRKELNGQKVSKQEERIQARGDGRFISELTASPFSLKEYPIRLNEEEMQKSELSQVSESE